jgi:hypothetical protein
VSAGSWRDDLVDDLRVALPPFVVARVLVLLAWLLANAVVHRWFAVDPVQIGDGLVAWDGTWYRDLAQVGYGGLPEEGVRFFPLYPLLGRALAAPFGGSAAVPLLVLANVAALGFAVLVRRLVMFAKQDRSAADRAVWAVTLFPPAFVLVWAYAESIMLVAAVGAFLAARRGRWWWAAALGLVAGATRPLGLALTAAMVIEAVREREGVRTADWLGRLAAVVAPIAGAGAFLVWTQRTYGDWSLPFTVQDQLRGQGANPLTRLVQGVGDMFGVERFGDGLHVPFAIAFVVLLVLTFRRWPASYGAYAAVVLAAALSAANFNSVERYALNAFPIVLTFALLLDTERWERLGLAVCGGGFVALTALAWIGVYVP